MKKIVYQENFRGKEYALYLILRVVSLVTFRRIRFIEDYTKRIEKKINDARALYLS